MITLTACGERFRVNKEAWPLCKEWELKNILGSLSDWINENEESMTEKQFDRAMKIKEELEEYIKKA